MSLPEKPITRKEMYLSNIAGEGTPLPDKPITREEQYLDEIAKNGGGGGGTTNYNALNNKPKINNVELTGNKTSSDLDLPSVAEVQTISANLGIAQSRIQTLQQITTQLSNEKADKSSLGTASGRDATSVVTDSTDLVESGAVKDYVDGKLGTIYSFHVSGTESNPANKITYIGDTEGMTPAHMDYINDVFDWGSWGNAFFLPRPCMVRSDGTVDYYLDPNDYTKRMDGTASDVGNIAYDGNAMMEWGRNGRKIWTKIVPDNDHLGADVHIADYQADSGFHDYSFHNCNGVSVDHFYTPIYSGSLDSNNKLRSMSGQQAMSKKTAEQEKTYAQANNKTEDVIWNTEVFADVTLINILLMLIGKSTNVQSVFGQGIHTGGLEAINNAFMTGVHNDKGMFYGTNSGSVTSSDFSNAVKVFGMENWWGFQWRRYQGHVMVDGVQKVKNTYGNEDGSTAVGYNFTGDGYKSISATALNGTSGNHIKDEYYIEDGLVPCGELAGSDTTYYCDGCWYNNSGVRVPFRGGYSGNGAKVGAFSAALSFTDSYSSWDFGAALSCKPLAIPDISTKCDNSVIAPVESRSTSSKAYAVGEHFIRDGAFCTCLQAIAQGGSFTLNTNYTAGDVASAFMKKITVEGQTSSSGNLAIFSNKVVKVVCAYCETNSNYVCIPFRTQSGQTYVHLRNRAETDDWAIIRSTNVTVTAYYFD